MPVTLLNSLPLTAVAFLAGTCSTLLFAPIPSLRWVVAVAALAIPLIYMRKLQILGVAAIGFALLCLHIHLYLAHALPIDLEAQTITVRGTISSVVEYDQKPKAKFSFNVSELNNYAGTWRLPANVQLHWNNAPANLRPGDIWQLQVRLKRHRNYANPGSFDNEKFYFQHRLVSTGYIIDSKANKFLRHNFCTNPNA